MRFQYNGNDDFYRCKGRIDCTLSIMILILFWVFSGKIDYMEFLKYFSSPGVYDEDADAFQSATQAAFAFVSWLYGFIVIVVTMAATSQQRNGVIVIVTVIATENDNY